MKKTTKPNPISLSYQQAQLVALVRQLTYEAKVVVKLVVKTNG
jgi:ABC-type Fe3+/spermidine/putrescine transport system ATPase subunit